VSELVSSLPWWKKPLGRIVMSRLVGKYDLSGPYHLETAELVRPVLGDTRLAVVGGMRTVAAMEQAVEAGPADLVSMSRPFIREPFLVKRIREGKTDTAACVSCNRCLAAASCRMPVRCYVKGFPAPR
jgi:2,4-dienoyl-CoA reductase-like NADH-dependent reductase (Old Yellow Enzyme family)